MFFGWRLGSLHFLSRGARMYNGRCLRSSMRSILCTACWDQSRTIQTAPHCQCPESLSWTSYWTGCRPRFVVGLVDEIVGEGDSRSSWQVHEHDNCQLVSQRNVAIQVFWRRCHLRLPLIACDFASRIAANNGFLRSIMVFSSSTLKFVRSAQGKQISRSVMIWVWIWLAWLWTFGLLNNFSIWFSSNFWTQLFHPIMFQRNLWRVTRCVAEDNCVRSCLMLSKLYVDAIHSILMSLPCFPHVLCKTRCFQLDRVKMLVFFVQRIHKQKEYSLSVAQHLWSWCQSWIHDGVWHDCFSDMINVLEDTVRYNDIVLWWRINKIASWMTWVSSEVQSWSWRISEVLLLTPHPAAKHLSIVSRFPLWTVQYLIIGVWVSVRFDGYLCCFQRQRNPNHTSNILCKKFSDGRSDINTFWYMTSSDSITSTVEIQ